jgi:hypothetical protein
VALDTKGSDSFVASDAAFDCYRVERTSSRAGLSPAPFTVQGYADKGDSQSTFR